MTNECQIRDFPDCLDTSPLRTFQTETRSQTVTSQYVWLLSLEPSTARLTVSRVTEASMSLFILSSVDFFVPMGVRRLATKVQIALVRSLQVQHWVSKLQREQEMHVVWLSKEALTGPQEPRIRDITKDFCLEEK